MADPKEEIQEPTSATSDAEAMKVKKATAGEEDKVAAAYENISKKLESIRSGKDPEESEESNESDESKDKEDEELEEWKGPKPKEPHESNESEEPEEHELRKVKLHNLEDVEEKPEDEEQDDDEDEEPKVPPASRGERVAQADDEEKKDWEPKEDDPLDEDDTNEEIDLEKEDKHEEPVEKEATQEDAKLDGKDEESEEVDKSEPDTLDDLTKESSFEGTPDDYPIPHLKASRQKGSNIGYNAPQQRESYGESYSPKSRYMDGNDPNNFFSSHNQSSQTPKRANKFHLLVLIIIGVVVIGFTVYVLKGGFGDIQLGGTQPSPSPSATATPEPTPTPTPEPEIERGDFTIRVLNGTSTSGLAAKVRDKLKETGYKTATPGNAKDSDVAQTEIRVKEGTESATLFERLKLDLAPDYEAKEGEKLDAKAAYDAEVIIGAK